MSALQCFAVTFGTALFVRMARHRQIDCETLVFVQGQRHDHRVGECRGQTRGPALRAAWYSPHSGPATSGGQGRGITGAFCQSIVYRLWDCLRLATSGTVAMLMMMMISVYFDPQWALTHGGCSILPPTHLHSLCCPHPPSLWQAFQ